MASATLVSSSGGMVESRSMRKIIASVAATIIKLVIGFMPLIATPAFAQSTLNEMVLITEQEAALPLAPLAELTFRAGVSRGPKITLIIPSTTDGTAQSPVHIELRFAAHGGATIDPKSFKIIYLKNPAVDLTERVRPFIGSNVIDIPAAEVPPGNHPIRVEVRDSDGRYGSVVFTLKVSQR